MKNTALRANKKTRELKKIKFNGEEHERFYNEYLKKCRYIDAYHQALVYTLGICEDTRKNFNSIYDIKSGLVKTECLRQGWITSGSARVIRIAFNLYCNGTPSVNDYEDDHEEALLECRRYTAEDLFCCSYAIYFAEALKIRYPEYFYPVKMEDLFKW